MDLYRNFETSQCSLFLIQELLDSIIECLSPSVSDLRSCALVSRPWVSRAQSYIFLTVDLTPEFVGEEKYQRCLVALQNPSHLARFVRHIIISVNPHWLTPVSSVVFTNLREVTMVKTMMDSVPTIKDISTRPTPNVLIYTAISPLLSLTATSKIARQILPV
ncbi:hypothetical protein C8R44DRAFT_870757 [Mycena epipterygia]|nr:hypothetical protein C8R44DRAFT_870757 [Mycena epipterygia]